MSYVNDLVRQKAARYECKVRFPIGLVEKRIVRARNEQNAKHLLSHAIGVSMANIEVVGRLGEP